MEWIQAFAAFFVVFAVAGAIIQVALSYSLQVIAEKNELPDFTSLLAWIPLLQTYPYIKVGGGSFKVFLLGGLGLMMGVGLVAAVAVPMMGDAGGAVAAILALGAGVTAVVYLARIAMGTAERRGLSKWIGLLGFVPPVNFFVYPYIAFHDGFRPPNKIGALIGLLLAFGPLPGQIAMVNTMSQQMQEVAQTDLGDGVTVEQAMAGLGTAMELGTQLALLEEMDPDDPDQARMMRETLDELRTRLDGSRAALGPEAAAEMEGLLARQEARLSDPGPRPAAAESPPDAARARVEGSALYDPPTLSAGPPLTDAMQRNGDQGFAIPLQPDCPPGTTRRGAAPPGGDREWCEKVGRDEGIKHGWMTEYHDNGKPKVAGEYRDGLRVGVWSRFYADGSKRVQAQFVDGLQHGVLLSWNPDGSLAYEQHFAQGSPASR